MVNMDGAVLPVKIVLAELHIIIPPDSQQTGRDMFEMKDFIPKLQGGMSTTGTVLTGIDVKELEMRNPDGWIGDKPQEDE